ACPTFGYRVPSPSGNGTPFHPMTPTRDPAPQQGRPSAPPYSSRDPSLNRARDGRRTYALRLLSPLRRLSTNLGRAGLHALADNVVVYPAGVNDDIKVVPGDRDGRQEECGHLGAVGAVCPFNDVVDLFHGYTIREFASDLGSRLAGITRVFPDR